MAKSVTIDIESLLPLKVRSEDLSESEINSLLYEAIKSIEKWQSKE